MSDFATTTTIAVPKDDYTWAANEHGFHTARSATLDVAAFTKATHYPNGYIPSGTPVRLVDDKFAPLTAEAVEYDGVLLEQVIIRDGQTVATCAVLDEGIVLGARLRGSVAGAKPAAGTGLIVR